MKTVKPSNSYQLSLPDDVREDIDRTVSSYWVEGRPLLLQLSSYIRTSGEQVGAEERLKDRMAKRAQDWTILETKIRTDSAVDEASAKFTDADGVTWMHSYLVWPHLTIYATIAGPAEQVSDPDNWSVCALKSIRLTVH